MVDFYPCHASRSKDGYVYNKPRKIYTRTKPIKKRLKNETHQPRIKATIIKLTKLGYSINQLADAFARSRSYIHKCVRTAITRGLTPFIDKRKLPAATRLNTSKIRQKNLSNYILGWLLFAKGETDKPP